MPIPMIAGRTRRGSLMMPSDGFTQPRATSQRGKLPLMRAKSSFITMPTTAALVTAGRKYTAR